ncbi:MAG: DUF1841 family protein [Pseudomonadota bacterium]
MLFGQDKSELRRMYAQAWQLAQSGQPMSALEQQIAQVVADHPEYHEALSGNTIDKDYTPDGGQSNPFLHMGLHLAIRDQVSTNRPPGIRDVYQRLALKTGDEHDAEHQMLECLAESLWQAQRDGQMPDEFAYLEKLSALL